MQSCICIYNLDITSGCAAGYNPETQSFEYKSENRCSYCYALRYNYHTYKPKTFNWTKLEKELKDKKIKVLRTGKATDPGYIDDRDNLKKLLTIAKKLKIKVIIITKLLEEDEELAELIKASESTLHISLGDDSKEIGAVGLGFNNIRRLEIAKFYHNLKVNTALRVVTDPTTAPTELDLLADTSEVPVLLTPLRYYNKASALEYGEDWEQLKQSGRYKHVHGSLHPNVDKFMDIWKEEKIRHCGMAVDNNGNVLEGCSGCQLFDTSKDWDYNIRKRG